MTSRAHPDPSTTTRFLLPTRQGWSAATLAWLLLPAAHAATLHVDDSAVPGGDGNSWSTPFSQLPDALAAAAAGDEIRVAKGTYKPTTGIDRNVSFVLPSGVLLLGGFAGLGAADPDARDITGNPTILSGNIGAVGSADNSWHVLRTNDVARGTLVEGFLIRDGFANSGAGGDTFATRGAGVLNLGGAPTFRLCTISHNTSTSGGAGVHSTGSPSFEQCTFTLNIDDSINDGDGGAIFQSGGALTVIGCSFTKNEGDSSGGAIAAKDSVVLVEDSVVNDHPNGGFSGAGLDLDDCQSTLASVVVTNNFAGGSGGDSGGGAGIYGGTLVAIDCHFANNYGNEGGGAVVADGAEALFVGCTFLANSASEDGGAVFVTAPTRFVDCRFELNKGAQSPANTSGAGGGAVHVASLGQPPVMVASFVRCDFLKNECKVFTGTNPIDSYGGAISTGGRAVAVDCRFLGNKARRGGGVQVFDAGRLTLLSCALSGNSAPIRAGAALNDSAQLTLRNVTVLGNSSTSEGGGVVAAGVNPKTTIANSILWGNSVGVSLSLAAQLLDLGVGAPLVDFTIIQGLALGQTLGGDGNLGLDPLLVQPKGPDGLAGTEDDNFTLAAGSAAIDSAATPLAGLDEADCDDDGVTMEFVALDLLGMPRFLDGPAPNTGCNVGAALDRGAVEMPGVGAAPLLGDLDGNGAVEGPDLGLLLTAWGACTATCCTADLNGDGFVNSLDLVLLRDSLWSPTESRQPAEALR